MKLGGQLLLPDGQECVKINKGIVHTDGPRIESIEYTDDLSGCDMGGDDYLITPGFIDTHVHLPQFRCVGAHGMDLLRWLDTVIFSEELRWADPEYARAAARESIASMLSCGTTGFAAFATSHAKGASVAMEEASYAGVRAAIGQVLMDVHAPDGLLYEKNVLMDGTAALLAERPPMNAIKGDEESRVSAIVSPRFALTCSMELMQASAALANETGAYIQTHLSEMQSECERAVAIHGDEDYTAVYERAGIVGPRTLFGHGVWLSDEELSRLAEAGSTVAHCPLANSFLFSGTMNRSRINASAVRLSLGSDIGAGYERSMVRVGRAMIEAAFHAGAETPSAAHAWWMITEGNAMALGWERAGALREGYDADLLLCRPGIDWAAAPDPLGMLMFGWDDRWLDAVLLRGERANAV